MKTDWRTWKNEEDWPRMELWVFYPSTVRSKLICPGLRVCSDFSTKCFQLENSIFLPSYLFQLSLLPKYRYVLNNFQRQIFKKMMCLFLSPNRNMPTSQVKPWVPGWMTSSRGWTSLTPGPKWHIPQCIMLCRRAVSMFCVFILNLMVHHVISHPWPLSSHCNMWI